MREGARERKETERERERERQRQRDRESERESFGDDRVRSEGGAARRHVA